MKTNQILWYNIGNLLHNFLGMTLAHISTFIHWPLYVKLLSSFISARSPSMDLNPIKWRPTVAVNLSSHGAVNRLLDDEEGERKYRIPLLPPCTHPHWLSKCCKAGLEEDLPSRSDYNEGIDSNMETFVKYLSFLG